MHELSLAESIVSTVIMEKERHRVEWVSSVGVRVGALSGVFPDALEFGFEMAVVDTPIEGSKLVIEEIAAQAVCSDCEKVFVVESAYFVCPHCEGSRVELIHGFELDIAYIETDT